MDRFRTAPRLQGAHRLAVVVASLERGATTILYCINVAAVAAFDSGLSVKNDDAIWIWNFRLRARARRYGNAVLQRLTHYIFLV